MTSETQDDNEQGKKDQFRPGYPVDQVSGKVPVLLIILHVVPGFEHTHSIELLRVRTEVKGHDIRKFHEDKDGNTNIDKHRMISFDR
jgi:hypothetical protein